MKYIAGIDPGLVTGVAIVDIDSDYSETFSRKYFPFSDLCDFLISKGEPIIIAADVAVAPDAVRKIAANFGARLYSPAYDILVDEKKEITEGAHCENAHERDALAAALAAKREFFRMFRKIDGALERKNLLEIKSEVKELLVKKEAGNIEQAVKLLSGSGKKGTKIVTRIMETKRIAGMRQEIERLMKSKSMLEEKIARLSSGSVGMKAAPAAEKIIFHKLTEENENLRKEIKNLESLIENVGEYEIICDLSSGIEGRVVFADAVADIASLEKRNPKAIISRAKLDTSVPVINPDKLPMKKIGRFTVARKKDIESMLSGNNFLEWLETYREERKLAG